jgi:transcriptional regulator with XRE-family HTH domain
MDKTFGDWLRQQRQKADLTLREMAEKLGVTHAHLSQVENGLATPGEELARKAARLFKADEREIVFMAREAPHLDELVERIKKNYPKQAPKYFRKVLRGDKK